LADTLIDAAKLHDYFDISKDIKEGRLTPHIGAASRRLRKWVGELVYTDALAAQPTDALRKADLQNAEAALAMHFALPGLNTQLTAGGVLKTRREGGAAGAPVILSYLTPSEVKLLAQAYLEQAEEIARAYILTDGTPAAEFEVAG